MEKSAILLVGNYSNSTGYAWNNIYRLFNVIARAMHARGLSVCLSFAQYEPPVTFIDKGIPFESFQFDPNNISIADLFKLAKAIKAHKIKYVYLTDQPGYKWLYIFLRTFGVRRIIVHSRVSVASPYPAPPEQGLHKFVKTAIGKARWLTPDRIYAVSEFVRSRLVKKNCLPDKKVIVILNGINLDKYRCDLNENKSDLVHIFVGARAVTYKGVPHLIRAAYQLVNEYKISNFIIEYAGDGPEMDEFLEEVESLGLKEKFIFLGQLNGTRDILCKADIVVVPSAWGDACPSAVSEALAAGKPLVTTLAGGIPEIVGDESNAVLVPPSDQGALACELAELISNAEIRQELGIRARKRAEEALNETDYYSSTINQLVSDLF